MFTFDDIQKLSTQAIREILKVADKRDLMIGLKGASEELKQNSSQYVYACKRSFS